MARLPRLQCADAIFHVTTRGALGAAIYRDDADRRTFMHTLIDVITRTKWRCHSYCLMGNHYHLLIWTPEPNLAAGMQRLNGNYAQTFARRHCQPGHVFHRRYHSELVQSERHLLEVFRYIALNPVRAGLCPGPLDWPWSSYAATVGQAQEPAFLTTTLTLDQFSPDPNVARRRLRAFVETPLLVAAWPQPPPSRSRSTAWLSRSSVVQPPTAHNEPPIANTPSA
jgi:REP element-mobilizing transposase RayT